MSASALGKRWVVRDQSPSAPTSAPELMTRLLRLRGITSRMEARAFLQPALAERQELANLETALDRLRRALREGERIAIYGDYDADGITATAVLVEGLTALGGNVIPYIPDRFAEGYGLNTQALGALSDQGIDLVIAVDTGTSAIAEIAYANERSLDVLVLDHHVPKDALPDAVAVVNPHLPGSTDDLRFLSGCGVAFIVLAALARTLGGTYAPESLLDLVAIGTICDVVPLTGANRALVVAGLRQMARRQRPGLCALLDSAGVRSAPTTHTVGFVIGPRLNAAGRLDHGIKSFDLLTTRDEALAVSLAAELETLNQRRRQQTDEALAWCRELARTECAGAPLIMVGHPEVGGGIVGLVASRLAEEHYRPAIVYRRGPEFSTGSARSIPEFDVHAALARAEHLMERFGGHHQAGGFTIRTERIEQLRTLLTEWAVDQCDWGAMTPSLDVDLQVSPAGGISAAQLLSVVEQLEPCGTLNPAPIFVARDALVREASLTADGRHLRMRLDAGIGKRPWPAIAFGLAAHRPRPGERVDIVYSINADRYGEAQMRVHDLAAGSA